MFWNNSRTVPDYLAEVKQGSKEENDKVPSPENATITLIFLFMQFPCFIKYFPAVCSQNAGLILYKILMYEAENIRQAKVSSAEFERKLTNSNHAFVKQVLQFLDF